MPNPTAKTLTPRQAEVLATIKQYITVHSHSPPMRQLGLRLNVSAVTIFEAVNNLEAKGWITRDKHKARSIRVLGICEKCGRGG